MGLHMAHPLGGWQETIEKRQTVGVAAAVLGHNAYNLLPRKPPPRSGFSGTSSLLYASGRTMRTYSATGMNSALE